MIRFDFDERFQDAPADRAMPWFARVLIADLAFNVIFGLVVVPWLIIAALLWPEPPARTADVEEDETPLVFMMPSEIPPAVLRERPATVVPDRPADSPRIELPGNTRPFEPGPPPAPTPPANTPSVAPPEPPAVDSTPGPAPEAQVARNASPITAPSRIEDPIPPAVGGGLREAVRKFGQYAQTQQALTNPLGGATDPNTDFQFDPKGIDFGPWLRRFVSQVRRNWFVPLSAQTFRGRVTVTMRIHRDGRITDLHVVQPSNLESFNQSSYNALRGSNPTEPLPREYPDNSMQMTVTFYYNELPGS